MSDKNVEHALNLIRPLFEEAQAFVDTMKVGDKFPAVKLAKQLAELHGQTGAQLYPIFKIFFDNHDELEVRRGSHGGLFKVESKSAAQAKVLVEGTVVEAKENIEQ